MLKSHLTTGLLVLLSSGSLSNSCCCGHAVHLQDKHINKAEKLVNIKRLNDKINSAFSGNFMQRWWPLRARDENKKVIKCKDT